MLLAGREIMGRIGAVAAVPLLLGLCLSAGLYPGTAQVAAQAAAAQQTTAPGPAQIAASSRAIQDSAAIARQEFDRLAITDGLRASLAAAASRHNELNTILEALAAAEHTRPERLTRLRDQALTEEQRLEQISTRISARRDAVGAHQVEWLERLGTFNSWLTAAPDRPELQVQVPELEGAIRTIEDVLAAVQTVSPELTRLEEELERLRSDNQRLLDRVAALRAGRREALLRREQPLLFSAAHLQSLRSPGSWRPADAVRPESLAVFVREHTGILLLHILAIIGLGALARRIRPHTTPEGGWSGLLFHPWAFAIFAATALLARRYILAPPLWDVVIWSLLAGSGAVLGSVLLRGRALRVMIVSVAAVYPLILLAEAVRVPAPIFRVLLASLAAAAVIGFPLLAWQVDPMKPAGWRARLVLAIATALSAAVLVAQVIGFDQLSRWLVHAMLTSAYVVFSVAFLLLMAHGAIRTLLRREYVGRARFVGALAVPLAGRLVAVLQIVLVILATLVLLDVWEVAPSPVETWRSVVGWGFHIVGLEITIARLIAAAFLIYLAVTASWFVRTVVNTEVSRSWGFERGVAESINSLVHYAVITLGVLFGLGALGVELQNFAIVAGALGVGIGFGLQNVVNNFVSGLILLFERPIRVGDTVEIAGEWGMIKKIGLRSTVVVTFSQSEMIVPNGDLVSEKVTNWTLTNPLTRIAIPVGVAYGSDVQKVLRILIETGKAHPDIVSDPSPMALFTGFGDSSLDFELRIWISEVPSRLLARSAVLAEIDRRFREENIEIPFPQRDLHLRSLDAGIAETMRAGDSRKGGAATADADQRDAADA